MTQPSILSPCYRLDDESVWLEGVDPAHYYWIWVNGNPNYTVVIPGLCVSSLKELGRIIDQVRSLQPGDSMRIQRTVDGCLLHCINARCYAIEGRVEGALTWHLLDRCALESLLMTCHPDWTPSTKDIELGRKKLQMAFEAPSYS